MSNATNKKKAERMYKNEMKKLKKIIGNKVTYSNDLYKIGKSLFKNDFLGVYTCDRIPNHIKKNKMAIVNLDSSNESGSHWVAIAKNNKNIILVYDSFGRHTHKILPSIYKKKKNN